MPEEIITTTTSTTQVEPPVVKPITTPAVPEVKTEVEGLEEGTEQQKSYVKIREDKAKEKLLKSLGVKTEEEAQTKLSEAAEALKKVNELERKLANAELDRVNSQKISKLTKLLDDENAFDTEALMHYIELDKITLDASGNVSDPAGIITALKTIKPHFFGQTKVRTDNYIKGSNQTQTNTVEEKYKTGNYVGAISDYLKANKK